jgi:hypothetical protein
MIHFHPDADDSIEYGTSIYEPILFIGKIYLSVLMSMLMMMLVRGADKRAFYLEVGIDEEIEAVVNKTIQDIRGREIKLNDFGDIQHVLNLIGMFDDYYLPVVDGEKPLDIEVIEGQKQDLASNDFLEYLRKAMVSGMGVPPAHIGYTEDLELAKTLTMVNGKFIRKIIIAQQAFTPAINKFVQTLYKNEFLINLDLSSKTDGKTDKLFDAQNIRLENISGKLPSPATLNFTNISELLGNVEGIVNKIVEILLPEEDNIINSPVPLPQLKFRLLKSLYRQYLPMIDWTAYEEMLDECILASIRDFPDKNEAMDDGMGGGDGMDDGGMDAPGGDEGDDMGAPNGGATEEEQPESSEETQTKGDTNANDNNESEEDNTPDDTAE